MLKPNREAPAPPHRLSNSSSPHSSHRPPTGTRGSLPAAGCGTTNATATEPPPQKQQQQRSSRHRPRRPPAPSVTGSSCTADNYMSSGKGAVMSRAPNEKGDRHHTAARHESSLQRGSRLFLKPPRNRYPGRRERGAGDAERSAAFSLDEGNNNDNRRSGDGCSGGAVERDGESPSPLSPGTVRHDRARGNANKGAKKQKKQYNRGGGGGGGSSGSNSRASAKRMQRGVLDRQRQQQNSLRVSCVESVKALSPTPPTTKATTLSPDTGDDIRTGYIGRNEMADPAGGHKESRTLHQPPSQVTELTAGTPERQENEIHLAVFPMAPLHRRVCVQRYDTAAAPSVALRSSGFTVTAVSDEVEGQPSPPSNFLVSSPLTEEETQLSRRGLRIGAAPFLPASAVGFGSKSFLTNRRTSGVEQPISDICSPASFVDSVELPSPTFSAAASVKRATLVHPEDKESVCTPLLSSVDPVKSSLAHQARATTAPAVSHRAILTVTNTATGARHAAKSVGSAATPTAASPVVGPEGSNGSSAGGGSQSTSAISPWMSQPRGVALEFPPCPQPQGALGRRAEVQSSSTLSDSRDVAPPNGAPGPMRHVSPPAVATTGCAPPAPSTPWFSQSDLDSVWHNRVAVSDQAAQSEQTILHSLFADTAVQKSYTDDDHDERDEEEEEEEEEIELGAGNLAAFMKLVNAGAANVSSSAALQSPDTPTFTARRRTDGTTPPGAPATSSVANGYDPSYGGGYWYTTSQIWGPDNAEASRGGHHRRETWTPMSTYGNGGGAPSPERARLPYSASCGSIASTASLLDPANPYVETGPAEEEWEVNSSAYADSLDEAQIQWIEEQLKATENPEGFF